MAADDPAAPKVIAFESIYSMDGDFGPIEAICDLADEFGALTISTRCMRSACTARAEPVSVNVTV